MIIQDKKFLRVQRLLKPLPHEGAVTPNTFGGGLRNGGMSPEFLSLLDGVLRFAYMGAAEYEHGEVPAAFEQLAHSAANRTLVAGCTTVKSQWSRREFTKAASPLGEEIIGGRVGEVAEGHIWTLVDKENESALVEFLHLDTTQPVDLPDPTYLKRMLFSLPSMIGEDHQPHGWLSLNTPALFFIDEGMWREFLALWEIQP